MSKKKNYLLLQTWNLIAIVACILTLIDNKFKPTLFDFVMYLCILLNTLCLVVNYKYYKRNEDCRLLP